ncbi:hypothetical protein PTKIN_Ptkin10aG0179100 [Pterospermum kingtungense]
MSEERGHQTGNKAKPDAAVNVVIVYTEDNSVNDEYESGMEVDTHSSTGTNQALNVAGVNLGWFIDKAAGKLVGCVKEKLKTSSKALEICHHIMIPTRVVHEWSLKDKFPLARQFNKVMKMEAAAPFNEPVNPEALGIPVSAEGGEVKDASLSSQGKEQMKASQSKIKNQKQGYVVSDVSPLLCNVTLWTVSTALTFWN